MGSVVALACTQRALDCTGQRIAPSYILVPPRVEDVQHISCIAWTTHVSHGITGPGLNLHEKQQIAQNLAKGACKGLQPYYNHSRLQLVWAHCIQLCMFRSFLGIYVLGGSIRKQAAILMPNHET